MNAYINKQLGMYHALIPNATKAKGHLEYDMAWN